MSPPSNEREPWDDIAAFADLEAFTLDDAPPDVAAGLTNTPQPVSAASTQSTSVHAPLTAAAVLAPSGRGDEAPAGDVESISINALRHLLVFGAALIVWAWAAAQVDDTALGDLGLIEALPLVGLAAIATLVIGFTTVVAGDRSGRLPGMYVIGLTVALHGMPTFAYDNLRFAWAWKHVGIVEFIQRTGGVDPQIDVLPVYHNWPGFFGVNSWITTSSQLDSALSYAAWAPLLFNLLFIAALYVLLKALTTDQRLIWTGLLFFVLGNWVGQDYFAPQALAYFFYLATLALLLRWFGSATSAPESIDSGALPHRVLVLTVTLAVLAIAMIHQLTPVMMIVALGALLVFKAIDVKWPLYTAVFFLAAWIIGPAWDFVVENSQTVLRDVGGFQANLESGITDVDSVSSAQATVAFVARSMTAGLVGLAALGWVSRRLRKVPTSVAVLLAVAPIVLILASSYGDEVLFRAYLFALPFLAWLAASVWFPSEDAPVPRTATVTLGIVAVTMAGAMMLANFGSDQRHVFSDSELAVAEFVYEDGAPGSLLVDLNRDYPGQFSNYENFTYITIDRSTPETQGMIFADPAGVLQRWLSDSRFTDGYVLITETMRESTERLGTLPAGAAATIENSLRQSGAFEIAFEAGTSVAFTLADDS